jgi:hypothetical protein
MGRDLNQRPPEHEALAATFRRSAELTLLHMSVLFT